MIRLVATSRRARAHSDEPITTGSAGIPISLTLSEDFDGLETTLVCEAGGVSRDLAVMGGELVVPHELLTHAGDTLTLGVYAALPDGTIVIPTVWAVAGEVVQGTAPSETSPSDPTPSWAAQVQQWAEDAYDTAERLAEEVDGWETAIDAAVQGAENVDAVASKSGTTATIIVTDREGVEHTVTVSDGAQGEAGRDGYSPTAAVTQGDGSATITITDKDGTTTATVHDGTDGRDGRDGADGADGYSPTATVTQTATGATITITDKSGTTTASVSNGTDGTDGTDGFSPTVDVQEIEGGHEVTITDADGAHSFEVMDGDPATPGSITDAMLAPDGIKPQVAQLFGNQLTGTLSGTIDTAADAYAAPPMALSVDGVSTQASYTGKNLFDKDGQKGYWSDTDGSFVSSSLRVWWSAPVSEGDVIRTSSAGVWSSQTYLNGEFVAGGISASSSSGYVIPAGVDEIRGSIANNGWDTGIVTKNNADLTYEPYTGGKPSPSPDWPQPILSVDELSLNLSKKNILKTIDATLVANLSIIGGAFAFAGAVTWAAGSKTYVIGEDNRYNNSNNYLRQPMLKNYPTYARRIPRGMYTFGFTQTGEMNAALRVGKLYEDGLYVTNGTTFEVTGDDWYYIFVVQLSNRTTDTTTYLYPQLVTGSTLGEWEPYVGTTVPDLLPEDTSLRSLPDGTKDELHLSYLRPSTRAGWAVYSAELVQAVDEVVVTKASRTYQNMVHFRTVEVYVGTQYVNSYSSVGGKGHIASNRFIDKPSSGNYVRYGEMCYYDGNGYMSLGFNADTFTTLAEADIWLADNPTYAYLALKTPIIHDLGEIELPTLPAPNVTVWCDGGSAQPTFLMQYVQDTDIVIADLRAALADLATS